MRIERAATAGFCFGVARAMEITLAELGKGRRVVTLGPLIHNPQVVAELESRSVRAVQSLQEVPPGAVAVIRSHGVPKQVYQQAAELGVKLVDATCPFVKKIHRIVGEENTSALPVLIAGDRDHPEVQGILGHCAGKAYVFNTKADLVDFLQKKSLEDGFIMVAQTTFNLVQYSEYWELVSRLPGAQPHRTVCSATFQRQQEAAELAERCDVCIVIGGAGSSNTKKLFDICAKSARTFQVETARELRVDMFKGAEVVGVTAGASTPATLIEEVLNRMSEITKEEFSFEEALENSMRQVRRGQRVSGVVTEVRGNEVVVDIGTKHTGFVPADEMSDDSSVKLEDLVKKGDELTLVVISVNDQDGIVTLSKKRADAQEGLNEVIAAAEDGSILEGYVSELVNKGLLAKVKGVNVFIPASHATLRRGEPYDQLLHTHVRMKILEVNPGRRRAVGSIRAVLQEEQAEKRKAVWDTIEVGKVYEGVVKSLTSYGAFVDIGGVDGMVHISELSWQRIRHPQDVVSVGDKLTVFVKDLDRENNRISLGYRKEEDNPWTILKEKYSVGDVFTAPVVSLTKFGAFVRILPGVDGLVHISEMSNERVEQPSDVVKVGDEVKVKLIGVDFDRQRVSLSMKVDEAED